MSCPWVKGTESAYDFDIKKADKIFDFLLEKKQLKLSSNHVIPLAGELKGKRYYKFYNVTTHSTNECRVFRQHVQKAIEQGKIKFESTKRPAIVNMVEFQLARGKTKVLTSTKAKEDRSVDPKVQISANEYKEAKKQRGQQKGRYEQSETSRAGAMHPRVTSRILLNKWQR